MVNWKGRIDLRENIIHVRKVKIIEVRYLRVQLKYAAKALCPQSLLRVFEPDWMPEPGSMEGPENNSTFWIIESTCLNLIRPLNCLILYNLDSCTRVLVSTPHNCHQLSGIHKLKHTTGFMQDRRHRRLAPHRLSLSSRRVWAEPPTRETTLRSTLDWSFQSYRSIRFAWRVQSQHQ